MKKKCICLVRVSSEAQSYDEQSRVIYNLAKEDGYDEDSILVIADKESAIKLSEEERNGLTTLKKYIQEDDSIDRVYLFALDRLARRKKVIFSIIEFLIEHKVNMIIKEPNHISLLNDDGTVNETTDLIISLFASLSEQEMKNKQARFKRAKAANKRNNLYNGGNVPIGYKIKNREFVKDENEFISELFTMYSTGNYSHGDLAVYFHNKGYLIDTKIQLIRQRITSILHNVIYTGKPSKNGYVYPRIISDELFEKCQNICLNKANRKGRNSKKLTCKDYLCRGLLRTENNEPMSVHTIVNSYVSYESTCNIMCNVLDYSVWYMVCPILTVYNSHKRNELFEENRKEIEDLNKFIKTSEKNIEKYKERIDALDESFYVEGRINREKYLKMSGEIRSRSEKESENISKYKERIKDLSLVFNSSDKEILNTRDLFSIKDKDTKFDLLREIVQKIIVKKTDKKYIKEIEIFFKHISSTVEYMINTYRKEILIDNEVIKINPDIK